MIPKPASRRDAPRIKPKNRPRTTKRAAGERSRVQVGNRQSHVRISGAYVRRLVETVLAAEGAAAASISIALADNATVRRINRDYLGHDYDTDVLSFLFESTTVPTQSAKRGRSSRGKRSRQIDGEILASAEMAARMASQFGWSARDELALYLVHGLLHLCGYDDRSPRDRRVMRDREQAVLTLLGISSTGCSTGSGSRVTLLSQKQRPRTNGSKP